MHKTRFILASASPRRCELLNEIGIVPVVRPTDADENIDIPLTPEETVEFLSKIKANAYPEDIKDGEILIAADTVVALDDKILGKPSSKEDAFDMLQSLSGRSHRVCTGITLRSSYKTVTTHDSTAVVFREMSDEEITAYVESGDPMDKAGAYGIQGEAGKFVSGIEGSLNNVIGLPTELIENILINEFDIEF